MNNDDVVVDIQVRVTVDRRKWASQNDVAPDVVASDVAAYIEQEAPLTIRAVEFADGSIAIGHVTIVKP